MPIAALVFLASVPVTSYIIVKRARKRGHEDLKTWNILNKFEYPYHRQKLTDGERAARWLVPIASFFVTLNFVNSFV